jgi:hypothetical protein
MITKDELLKISKMNALAVNGIIRAMTGDYLNARQVITLQDAMYKDLLRDGAIDQNAEMFDEYYKTLYAK